MTQPKETLVVDIFEATETIFFSTRHLLDDDVQAGLLCTDGVISVVAHDYRLVIMYCNAFTAQEVAPQVLAMLCIKLGLSVDDLELKVGESFLPSSPAEIAWLAPATRRIEREMRRSSLHRLTQVCDEEIAAHTEQAKELRRIRRTALRQLAKLD